MITFHSFLPSSVLAHFCVFWNTWKEPSSTEANRNHPTDFSRMKMPFIFFLRRLVADSFKKSYSGIILPEDMTLHMPPCGFDSLLSGSKTKASALARSKEKHPYSKNLLM